jgi:tRNA(Arg) A34 adenosine deaminase TadA
MQLDKYMVLAIEEAKVSLREGNNGFGAVIVKEEQVIALAHDKECTEHDATAHAEINAIKKASKKIRQESIGLHLDFYTRTLSHVCYGDSLGRYSRNCLWLLNPASTRTGKKTN